MKAGVFNAHTKYIILKHALKEKNVTHTCKLFGISRMTYYKWKRAYQKNGMMGLEIKEPQKPQMPNKVDEVIEQEILLYVARHPEDGPKRIYYELMAEGFEIGESGIYNVLRRYKLSRKEQRMDYSENKDMQIKSRRKHRESTICFDRMKEIYPGFLVTQRIDFMGTFDRIGKIYQYSFYDTTSKWVVVKLYNKKQDIDIWNFFELKLVYLLKTFNLSIKNLVSERTKIFFPYFVKGNKYKEIIEDLNINHYFVSSEKDTLWNDMKVFNEYLMNEFYNKITKNSALDSFFKVERELNKFVRNYNFTSVISNGKNAGKTPAEVVLKRAAENNADLDTLPLWIQALLNVSRGGDKDG
ncbi:helix-turn-helix domain-containing protein [Clostridium sp. D2Q-11]|uniref:Helix-turn-helix domain-containing protein n=1 Tax=Anaeromonas frigoriresistens TaxID=2683708 RepID=A0A942UVL9_9FIRM|nr:helix-turn-helix domain-containing protein [Anaeromonas frigoriresistens]MBS4539413.1 helix-turn-helix domain-containing protein [Anaeromonas frigoriresistens]